MEFRCVSQFIIFTTELGPMIHSEAISVFVFVRKIKIHLSDVDIKVFQH